MKFVAGMNVLLSGKVRSLIDWDMSFDEILCITENIQTSTKLTIPQQVVQKQKQCRQWSQRKPMEFQKSNYKQPTNVVAAQQRGAPHPDAKNSIKFGYVPNARNDNTKYKTFTAQNPEKDQLATEDTCFLREKPSHIARDCPTRKLSCSYHKSTGNPCIMSKLQGYQLSLMWIPDSFT